MILRRRSLRKRLIRGRGPILEILMTKTNRIHRRIYLPRNKDLQSEVPTEAHPSSYSIGPWSTKIYPNPRRQHYRWNGMRSDIAHFHVDRSERNAKSQEALSILWKFLNGNGNFVQGQPRAEPNEITILLG